MTDTPTTPKMTADEVLRLADATKALVTLFSEQLLPALAQFSAAAVEFREARGAARLEDVMGFCQNLKPGSVDLDGIRKGFIVAESLAALRA